MQEPWRLGLSGLGSTPPPAAGLRGQAPEEETQAGAETRAGPTAPAGPQAPRGEDGLLVVARARWFQQREACQLGPGAGALGVAGVRRGPEVPLSCRPRPSGSTGDSRLGEAVLSTKTTHHPLLTSTWLQLPEPPPRSVASVGQSTVFCGHRQQTGCAGSCQGAGGGIWASAGAEGMAWGQAQEEASIVHREGGRSSSCAGDTRTR